MKYTLALVLFLVACSSSSPSTPAKKLCEYQTPPGGQTRPVVLVDPSQPCPSGYKETL